MGLDLEPLGRARAGREAEWDKLLLRLYAEEDLAAAETKRLIEISIPPYADIGAPQVGFDPEADTWLLARARRAGETKPDAEIIAENTGYHVLDLLRGKSDGVPAYSNSAMGTVGATSFRGEFLKDCTTFLDRPTIDLAWRSVIPPSEAVVYGNLLLGALDRPAANPPLAPANPMPGDIFPGFRRLFGAGQSSGAGVQEQRQIIDAAGRWYVFWGERGNPVWANF